MSNRAIGLMLIVKKIHFPHEQCNVQLVKRNKELICLNPRNTFQSIHSLFKLRVVSMVWITYEGRYFFRHIIFNHNISFWNTFLISTMSKNRSIKVILIYIYTHTHTFNFQQTFTLLASFFVSSPYSYGSSLISTSISSVTPSLSSSLILTPVPNVSLSLSGAKGIRLGRILVVACEWEKEQG